MRAHAIFFGNNGDETKALYGELEAMGPAGVIAMNLFRACKCSGRAKVYRGRTYKDLAYGRKVYSITNLCRELKTHAESLGIVWGWKEDKQQTFHRWVLYVDIPVFGQVSFHNADRLAGPDYPKEWDGVPDSPRRIINYVNFLLAPSK